MFQKSSNFSIFFTLNISTFFQPQGGTGTIPSKYPPPLIVCMSVVLKDWRTSKILEGWGCVSGIPCGVDASDCALCSLSIACLRSFHSVDFLRCGWRSPMRTLLGGCDEIPHWTDE